MSLPLAVFGYLSSISSVDILKEVPLSKVRYISIMLKVHYIALTLTYFVFGFAGYYRYGNDLSYYESGIILLNADFAAPPYLFCNFLVVTFIVINHILNFKPQKNILTFVFRRRERDSTIWHYSVIMLIHFIQTLVACFLINGHRKVHQMVLIVYGTVTPFVKFVFPLIVFNKYFFNEKKYRLRRRVYFLLIAVGLFVNFVTLGNVFLDELVRMLNQ